MPIDKDQFRRVLGHLAVGVTVVTTRSAEGTPHGLTVTSFTSLSLSPPLVLVCIDKTAESYDHFRSGVFAVNLLAEGQDVISQRFAKSGGDKFSETDYRWGTTGAPILAGTLGCLECRIAHAYEGGDHTIFVGEVEAANASTGEPLLYFRGAYRRLG
ncbi:MAG: flavin reductase family protein [Deltaproteobacteria bacterium]|nr:flavin reductase family protein [Deltaproteobacteria bacterium]